MWHASVGVVSDGRVVRVSLSRGGGGLCRDRFYVRDYLAVRCGVGVASSRDRARVSCGVRIYWPSSRGAEALCV